MKLSPVTHRVAGRHPWPAGTEGLHLCAETETNPVMFDESLPQGLAAPCAVCTLCPIRDACARLAEVRGESGVWGGRLFDAGVDITDAWLDRHSEPMVMSA